MIKKFRLEFGLIILTFSIMMLYTYYDNGVLRSVFRYITQSDFRNTINGLLINENTNVVYYFLKRPFTNIPFDEVIIWGTMLFQLFIPLLSCIFCIQYYSEHITINKMKYHRKSKYKKYIFKDIAWISLKCAMTIFSGYLIFYLITITFSPNPIQNPDLTIPRTLILDIVGNSFYYSFPKTYWFLEGSIRFFIVPFQLSFVACVFSLIFKSSRLSYITVVGYYFVMSALMAAIGQFDLPYQIHIYLNPSVIMASGSYNISTIPLILCSFIPFVVSTLILNSMWSNIHDSI